MYTEPNIQMDESALQFKVCVHSLGQWAMPLQLAGMPDAAAAVGYQFHSRCPHATAGGRDVTRHIARLVYGLS